MNFGEIELRKSFGGYEIINKPPIKSLQTKQYATFRRNLYSPLAVG